MPTYTPATGNAVTLDLGGAYAPASGGAVSLDIAPLEPGRHYQGTAWRILAQAGEETAWALASAGQQEIAWRDFARGSAGLAWALWHDGTSAAAWRILRGGEEDTAWRFTARDRRAVAWRILSRHRQPSAWVLQAFPRIKPGLYHSTGIPFERATEYRAEAAMPSGDPPEQRREFLADWDAAQHRKAERLAGWGNASRRRREWDGRWAETSGHRASEGRYLWRSPERHRSEAAAPWDAAHPRWSERAAPYRAPAAKRSQRAIPWGPFTERWREWTAPYRDAARQRRTWRIPWGQLRHIRWEERWRKELTAYLRWHVNAPYHLPYIPDPGGAVRLMLQCRLLDWPGYAVWLQLRERPCPDWLPRRSWVLVNTVTVIRLPDLTPVPVLGLTLSSDLDSWAWGVSLTIPDRDALALISPVGGDPIEIQITINGHTWTALCESYEERREFGRAGFTVRGRSRSAYLAAPYAAARSHEEVEERTAIQLAEQELENTDWTVDWLSPDWLVPAGAWAYQGKTPLEALAAIATAVGGVVQSDKAGDVLHVLPRYPISPWNWAGATPDATLTDNLVRSLGLAWEERPAYQGVYVSGASQGVLVRVYRTGSDGTPTAPLIVDPLITHVDAGRERGRNLLSAGGKQARVTIELPLLTAGQNPGLLETGMLVDVDDGVDAWRGLVTGVAIECGRPWVQQRVEVERHYA